MRESESLVLASLKAAASEKMVDRELLRSVKEHCDTLLSGVSCAATDMHRALQSLHTIQREVEEVIAIADQHLKQLTGTVPDITRDHKEVENPDWEMDQFARDALREAYSNGGKIEPHDFEFLSGSAYRDCEVETGVTLNQLIVRALESGASHIEIKPAVIQHMLEEVNPVTARKLLNDTGMVTRI